MVPEVARGTNKVIVQKDYKVTHGSGDSGVSRRARTAMWRLQNLHGASRFLAAQHLDGAVGRTVDNEDEFVIFRSKVLRQECRHSAFQ
jgi:hypothetical protein